MCLSSGNSPLDRDFISRPTTPSHKAVQLMSALRSLIAKTPAPQKSET